MEVRQCVTDDRDSIQVNVNGWRINADDDPDIASHLNERHDLGFKAKTNRLH